MVDQKEEIGAVHRLNETQDSLVRDLKKLRTSCYIGLVVIMVVFGALVATLWATRAEAIQSAIRESSRPSLVDPASGVSASERAALMPTLKTYEWEQGQPPVKLLRENAGHCYLSHVQGGFKGGGEMVGVYVEDGWWWLGGRSAQRGMAAKAIAVVWDESGLP